jgi:hypothetical protein
MAVQVLEGTWEEVRERLEAMPMARDRHVRVVVSDDMREETEDVSLSPPAAGGGRMMTFGMFPQLKDITDEDIKSAEFHGDPDDGLDWS